MKKLIRHQCVDIRTLYQRKDKTYFVRVETWNYDKNCYNASYDINFGMFSEALDCVNYKEGKV